MRDLHAEALAPAGELGEAVAAGALRESCLLQRAFRRAHPLASAGLSELGLVARVPCCGFPPRHVRRELIARGG